jgi:hypothetical protein
MSRSGRRRVAVATVLLWVAAALSPGWAAAAQPERVKALTADLDGKPLVLAEVGRHFCHDFDYPAIHCFSSSKALEASVSATLATTDLLFVVLYEYPLFAGSYIYISQDYSALVTIGWNDRASSFIARNNQAGHFYTDWFYGGTGYYFCCNQQIASLGSFDNTFSSVHLN